MENLSIKIPLYISRLKNKGQSAMEIGEYSYNVYSKSGFLKSFQSKQEAVKWINESSLSCCGVDTGIGFKCPTN